MQAEHECECSGHASAALPGNAAGSRPGAGHREKVLILNTWLNMGFRYPSCVCWRPDSSGVFMRLCAPPCTPFEAATPLATLAGPRLLPLLPLCWRRCPERSAAPVKGRSVAATLAAGPLCSCAEGPLAQTGHCDGGPLAVVTALTHAGEGALKAIARLLMQLVHGVGGVVQGLGLAAAAPGSGLAPWA